MRNDKLTTNCLLNEKILGAEATQVGSEFHWGMVKGKNELWKVLEFARGCTNTSVLPLRLG